MILVPIQGPIELTNLEIWPHFIEHIKICVDRLNWQKSTQSAPSTPSHNEIDPRYARRGNILNEIASGIFATAASAIALRVALLRFPSTLVNAEDVDRVWVAAAFIANACVFLATGLLIVPGRILHEPALVAVAVAGVWAARLLLATAAARQRRDRATIFLAGMRGALPLALALSLPTELAARPQIIDATYAIVLVTIVAQGAPLVPVVARLYRVIGAGPP